MTMEFLNTEVTAFCNPVSEMLFYHLCHNLLVRSHCQVQLAVKERTHKGMNGGNGGHLDHFRSCPTPSVSSFSHVNVKKTKLSPFSVA